MNCRKNVETSTETILQKKLQVLLMPTKAIALSLALWDWRKEENPPS